MADNKFFLDQNEYHLTDEQADIVDEKDKEFPPTVAGNIGFNTWFRGFLRENSIKPVNRRMAAWFTGTKNNNEDAVKLAVTLRAMRSIVSVIDPEHNLSVEYNDGLGTSAWDNGTRVLLPSKPVLEADDLHEAINIESGYAIHEACHSKHTRKVVSKKQLADWKASEPSKVNRPFANLLEDERIEHIEMQENPGFRSYLNTVMDSLWVPEAIREFMPEKWEDCNAEQKFAVSIPAIRYPEKSKELLGPSYEPVINAARALSEEYTSVGEDMTFDKMKQFVNRLKNILTITAEDETEMPQPDGAKMPTNLMCDVKDNEEGLDEDTRQDVYDLVDQEVEELDPKDSMWMVDGTITPIMRVYRPRVLDPSMMPRADNLMNKANAALTLRKAAPRADERHMLSGEIDEDELSRLFMDDMRVFRDITEEVLPSAAVYLLVDCSGSMRVSTAGRWTDDGSGSRLDVAQKMAFLLLSSMRSKPNVICKVLAHTGDNEDSADSGLDSNANFYRIWEEGDDINRLSIIQSMVHGENYDSFAVAWAGNMLDQENAEQKLLIVLSDGEPSGRRYGGPQAMIHTRRHVDRLMRKGIDVLSIAVAPDLSEDAQRQMYKHYITAASGSSGSGLYNSLLNNLQRILEKVGSR